VKAKSLRHIWLLPIAVILLVGVLVTAFYIQTQTNRSPSPSLSSSPSPSPSANNNNPIEIYASSLPPEIVEKLKPLGNNRSLNTSDLNLIFTLGRLQSYANSSTVVNTLDVILSDGGVSDDEVAAFQDLDHDYISNALEIERYKTDPTKMDTSGLGIDDFNAIFTYGLDPNNKTQIQQFLLLVPDVSPRQWYILFGGVGDTSSLVFVGSPTNVTVSADGSIIEVSMRDPLIKYLAKRANIAWNNYTKTGYLLVNGTPVWNSYDFGGNPSYYFTHGRIGRCGDTTLATMSILKLMGYKTLEVKGSAPSNGTMDNHIWCETVIDGKVYVVNYGELIPREGFYQKVGWVISESSNYDSDWCLK
jgi:hypothetical protein